MPSCSIHSSPRGTCDVEPPSGIRREGFAARRELLKTRSGVAPTRFPVQDPAGHRPPSTAGLQGRDNGQPPATLLETFPAGWSRADPVTERGQVAGAAWASQETSQFECKTGIRRHKRASRERVVLCRRSSRTRAKSFFCSRPCACEKSFKFAAKPCHASERGRRQVGDFVEQR